MTDSGGGGLGARFLSGLGAIGNILRLSSGSQNIPNDVIPADDDEDAMAVHDVPPGPVENLEDEIAPTTLGTNLPENSEEDIEYEGQIIRDMKISELKSALKREGIASESRMTKKQCVELLEDSRKKRKLTTNNDVTDDKEEETARPRPVRSTPRKELRTAAETSASVSKMTTRRSAAALGPPSSNLRHRSPPPAPAVEEKKKAVTRTPSAKVESSASSSKRDRKKSLIYDDYELSGTAIKAQLTVAPASTKKTIVSRKKRLTVEKVAVSITVSNAFDGRSVVGLDEIGIDKAYGANRDDDDDAEEDVEDKSNVASLEHKGTPKVMSRADFELSLKKKTEVPQPILMEEHSSDGNAVEENKSILPPGQADGNSKHVASNVSSEVAPDAFINGSEDESFLDHDYPDSSIPNRDEDGADADAEDEEGEDEDDDEEDKFAAPYDEEAEGDDEYENTAGEEEEMESEVEGIMEIPMNVMITPIAINGDTDVVVENSAMDEEEENVEEGGEDEQEGEEGGEEEEEESIQPTLLPYVPPSSIKYAITEVFEIDDEEEDQDQDVFEEEVEEVEEEVEGEEMTDEVQEEVMDEENEEEDEEEEEEEEEEVDQDGAVIDLISSEEEESGDGPDDDGGNDSFLTADTNDPTSAPLKVSSAPPRSDIASLLPKDVHVTKEVIPEGDTVLEAVNTVLNAFKGTLSTEDFKQLEVMMRKRKERPGDHYSSLPDTVKALSSSSPTNDNSDPAPPKKKVDRESRLSGDGSSWTSRESFLPPTPHHRFNASDGARDDVSSVIASQGSGKNGGILSVPSTITSSNNRGVGVRFQDDAAFNGEAVRSHIRYGPVTFSRRPMTPFARKTVASPSPSPSPFNRNISDSISSSASGFNNRLSLGAALPYPSTEDVQRKRRLEESAIYSASAGSYDDREVSEAKRVNFGQARYSVSNYEQTLAAFAPLDNRYGPPILSSVTPGNSVRKTPFTDSSFSLGSNMTGNRISQAPYTPTFRDGSSSGMSTGILLQPSQSQTKRASLSFAQRRLNQRLSLSSSSAPNSSKNSGTPSSGSVEASTSAFASASVAKRILDSLSKLQTPMEEARHRPIAVAAALSASNEALIRSRIVPENTTVKTPTFTFAPPMASVAPVKELTPTVMTFPTWPSVGQAAVAASMSAKPFSLPVPEVKVATSGLGGGLGGGFQFLASIPTKVPPPVPFAPTPPQITISTPKTSIVRFVETDSEFTFGEPSVVEGLDPEEVEKILTPADKKRDERMKFAFSPPGKMCRSAEKSRKSLGLGQGGAFSTSQSIDSSATVQGTSKSTQNTAPGESLWSKAAAAASEFQKCASCFVQNSNTASSCVSCESSLKSSGPAQPIVDFFPMSAPTTPAPFQFGAPSAALNKPLSTPVPAVIAAPVAGSLWAMAASADVVKCTSCFVQNPKGTLKCLSCENVLDAVSVPLKSVAAPIATAAPFSFNAPISTNPAIKPFSSITMPDSASVPTTSTSFKFVSTPSAAPFGAPSLVPPVSAAFTGFSSSAVAPPLKDFGHTAPSANPFRDSSSSIPSAAAPSSSAAGAGTGTGAMTFGASSAPASDDKKSQAMFSFGTPATIAPSSAPSNSFTGFQGLGLPSRGSSAPTNIADPLRIAPSNATPAVATPVASVAPSASPAPFAFGSIPSTSSTPLPAATFTSPAFSFGAPQAATTAFQFGATATVTAKQPEAMSTFVTPTFSFGSVAAPAALAAISSAPFAFGAPSPSPFIFGTAAAQTSTPSNSSYSSSAAVHGMDSPNSTMDTGYASGDASTVGYPPVTMPTTFGGPAVPFTFGAPAAVPASHSQPPLFGNPSPFSNTPTAYSLPSSAQPFTFGALPQAPTQPNFGCGAANVDGAAFSQPMSAPFMFGASPANNVASNFSSQGMGVPPSVGGFSMGATDSQRSANTTRKKVKAKRPVGQ